MTSALARIGRAIRAAPFLLVAAWCWREMNLEQIAATAQPAAESGFIEWGNNNKVAILDHFHGVAFFDQLWRGGTATFSVSTFGYDGIAAWQAFTFLVDLGPVYAIWLLESHRAANAWTPAYIPTVFTLVAQVLGIGPTAPIFYFLCLVFSPTSSELRSTAPTQRPAWSKSNSGARLLLPLVLALHTAVVFAMFLAPTYEARHWWTWAWQLSPLWIGVGNVVAGYALNTLRGVSASRPSAAPKYMLAVLILISTAVWVYTLLYAPYSLSVLFTPGPEPCDGLVLRSRKALQADWCRLFTSSFLWSIYSVGDLYSAGLIGFTGLSSAISLPIVALAIGPGSAFALSWYMRERVIGSAYKS